VGIASLVLGIFALLTCGIPMSFGGMGIFLGLIAVILGILGRRRLLEEGRSAGVALGGLITGVLGLLGGLSNMILCLTLCGAASEAANEADVQAGQDLAAQQLQNLGLPTDPAVPATPGTPPMPGMPAMPGTPPTPGMPQMPQMPAFPTVGGGVVTVGSPVAGMFTPGLPVDGDNRAYMDYSLTLAAPATYTITLMSPSSAAYDPYLRLMQNGVELEHDDDGAGYPNSRISRFLAPGTYTVRVTSFRRGQVAAPAAFTLMAIQG
jgi:hypothetical protein